MEEPAALSAPRPPLALRGRSPNGSGPLAPDSRFAASILEKGIGEIINDCASDPRALDCGARAACA